MIQKLLLSAALLLLGNLASAQNTRVLLDTDRGPLLLELDVARAPVTSANFLRYVDEGVYNDTLLPRVIRDFVVQGGGVRANGSQVTRRAPIASERTNGLLHTPGTLAMALSGNPPNTASATSDFFINTGTNSTLNGVFTVFGKVIFGTKTLAEINTTPVTFFGSEQPIRIPLVRRASRVAAGEFPILPLHSGAWFDPANSGKGFLIEVSQTAGSEAGPIMVVSWYDYFEGQQIWLSGIAPFAHGASSVEVPLQITSGAQFGAAFASDQVVTDGEWGRITLTFSGCDAGTFSYTSRYGNGTVPVRSLTLPTNQSCVGN
jgi:peptidyl-prolyl cis-trans isomerase A (cyclophilin A)